MLASLLLLAAQGLHLEPTVSVASLEKDVLPDVRLKNNHVSPAANGWLLAAKAVAAMPKKGDESQLLTEWRTRVKADTVARTRRLVESYRASRRFLDRALQRPRWVPPIPQTIGDLNSSSFRVISEFHRFEHEILVEARLDLADNRPDLALRELRTAYGVANRVGSGDGDSIWDLLAIAYFALVDLDARLLCSNSKFSARNLEELLQMIPYDRSLAALQNSLRHEFRDKFLVCDAQITASNASRALAPFELSSLVPDFGNNPKALDRRRTARLGSEVCEQALATVRVPWADRTPNLYIEGVIMAPVGGAFLELGRENPDHRRVGRVLARVANALGLTLIDAACPSGRTYNLQERQGIANLRATAIVAANQIYRRRFRRDISRLQDLVSAHLLKSVPMDPFSDRPLQFDSGTREIVSVGDGVKQLAQAFGNKRYRWRVEGRG